MQRRSLRLIETGYYMEHGSPRISYKETLYRIFRRKSQRGGHQNPDPLPDPVEYDQEPITIHIPEPWTPNTGTHRMSLNGTQIRRNMITTSRGFLTKYISHFFTLLLAFGLIHMHFQLKEVQQELQSLTRRMDTVAPLADAVPNYALQSQGAKVLEHLSAETYWPCKNPGLLWDRIFYWRYSSKTQQRVIQGQSALRPGQCWCFPGDRGHLFISLSHPVSISHVTLGHVQKSQAPGGYIGSAPREFSIYGMRTADSAAEEGTYLGTLAYNQDGAAFQTFRLSNPDNGVFRYVKLQIENNWGNTDYTCLYSFRVHADTVKGPGD